MVKHFIRSTKITVFKGKQIRRLWDKKQGKWYFSVVDIVKALTDSVNVRDYWFKMKIRVKNEDKVELSTICRQLKLESTDGKKYQTDCADTETLFRIIQSIPSPKAEPFKHWLAKVGYERVQDINDPERSLNRTRKFWQKHRVKEPDEYAILTNIIHQEWSDLSVNQHKQLKGLK